MAGQVDAELFEVEFVRADGRRLRGPFLELFVEAFENALPVRPFRWSRSQGHFPGWWWSSTSGRHVGYESWLERDHAMLLDFEPDVVGFSSQPFYLRWHDGVRVRRHPPDYFARRGDGRGVVLDVRARDRVEEKDVEVFAAMERACTMVGWDFRRKDVLDPIFAVNLRWLARYRHPRCRREPYAARLIDVFAEPGELGAGARSAGERLAVLPVLYHLLWTGELACDLTSAALQDSTNVASGARGTRVS